MTPDQALIIALMDAQLNRQALERHISELKKRIDELEGNSGEPNKEE
jgi:hypothetical protein